MTTCTECGDDGADVTIGVCYDCHAARFESDAEYRASAKAAVDAFKAQDGGARQMDEAILEAELRGVHEGIRLASNHVAARAQSISNVQGGHLVNGVVLCGELVGEIRALPIPHNHSDDLRAENARLRAELAERTRERDEARGRRVHVLVCDNEPVAGSLVEMLARASRPTEKVATTLQDQAFVDVQAIVDRMQRDRDRPDPVPDMHRAMLSDLRAKKQTFDRSLAREHSRRFRR